MKLTAVILLSACLAASANGHSQNVTLNLKDAPLEKVFNEIRKQTGYDFVYKTDVLEHAAKVTLSVQNASLQQVLDLCFKDQPLTYKIFQSFIAVKTKDDPTNITDENLPPPPIDVKGRVVNENGEPVQGAYVAVKGPTSNTKGSITNTDGSFALTGVDENATLIITAVNIEPYEIKVNRRTDLGVIIVKIKITVSEAVEVKVNTGYQTFKPNEVTGSVVVITKAQLDQRVETNIINKLEGITNGLVFNKTNNGVNKLRIRGESTINAYAEPLIFVDNFPFTGDINSINPNDVESITILKDAAAASFSGGAQSGNGVIVITTKRGKLNQPLRVSLTVNTTIVSQPDLFYKPQISSTDYIGFESILFSKGFYNSTLNNINRPVVSPVIEILNKRKLGQISAQDSASQIDALRSNDYRNDYSSFIYQKAVLQQYYLSMSGGSSKVSYLLSGGYDRALESVIGNQNSRITLNSRATYIPAKNVEVNADLQYSENLNKTNGLSVVPNIYPYTQLTDNNGNQLAVPQRRKTFEDTIANHGFLDWKYYPLQERDLLDNKAKNNALRILTGVKYTLLPGLKLEVTYQYLRSVTQTKAIISEESYMMRDLANKFAILNNGNYAGTRYPKGGRLSFGNSELLSHNGRASLTFLKNWGKHRINNLLGMEIRENKTESNSFSFYGYNPNTGTYATPTQLFFTTYPNYPSGSGMIGTPPTSYAGKLNRFRSYFSSVSYTYKDRYIVYSSFRFDASNYFGVKTNKKTVPLWSAGAKWDLDKEGFFKKITAFKNLSIRASYGYNGNLAPGLAAVTTVTNSSAGNIVGLPFSQINNIPNPQLRWEKSGQLNLGLDFEIKGSRLSGSVDYFNKKGKDMIGETFLDPTTGVLRITGNFSGLTTNGMDIILRSINVDSKFKWVTTFNFSYAADKVTKYDIPLPAASFLNATGTLTPQIGQPLYRLFSFRWAGLDPANGNPRIYLGDTINKSYILATVNSLKESDLVYSGRYNPPVTGSIFNSLSWNGITLSFNIVYKLNYYFRRNTIQYSQLITDWKNGHSDYSLRWQKLGDEKNTNVPSFIYPLPAGNDYREQFYTNSDILVEKGDHIRLQYINLNYSFPRNFLNQIKMGGLDAYFYVNNVGILWRKNKKGIDPDNQIGDFPSSRTYSFGIRTTF